MGDFFGRGAWLGELFELSHCSDHGLVDTALEVHWIDAGSHVLEAFNNDRLGQHGCGGCTVTGVVGGLGSNFLDQLCADIFKLVFEFDFFRDRHAVFSDGWGTERTLEDNVTTLWAESCFHCIGENIYATDDTHACVIAE